MGCVWLVLEVHWRFMLVYVGSNEPLKASTKLQLGDTLLKL